jgi:hypothetical protein
MQVRMVGHGNDFARLDEAECCGIAGRVMMFTVRHANPDRLRDVSQRATRSLRSFRVWRNTVPRGRGEVEHVLWKHLDKIVDNVPHGYGPGRLALVID